MRLFSNIRIYERIGGLYDASLGFWSREVRRQAAGALYLREDERLLIIGVGTGMELEHLPEWVRSAGVDSAPACSNELTGGGRSLGGTIWTSG